MRDRYRLTPIVPLSDNTHPLPEWHRDAMARFGHLYHELPATPPAPIIEPRTEDEINIIIQGTPIATAIYDGDGNRLVQQGLGLYRQTMARGLERVGERVSLSHALRRYQYILEPGEWIFTDLDFSTTALPSSFQVLAFEGYEQVALAYYAGSPSSSHMELHVMPSGRTTLTDQVTGTVIPPTEVDYDYTVVYHRLTINLGGTPTNPTTPAAIPSVNIPAGVNILAFLAGNHANSFVVEPTRSGHIFQGWYMDAFFITSLTQMTTMPDTSITIYARWSADLEINTEASVHTQGNSLFHGQPTVFFGEFVDIKLVFSSEMIDVTTLDFDINITQTDCCFYFREIKRTVGSDYVVIRKITLGEPPLAFGSNANRQVDATDFAPGGIVPRGISFLINVDVYSNGEIVDTIETEAQVSLFQDWWYMAQNAVISEVIFNGFGGEYEIIVSGENLTYGGLILKFTGNVYDFSIRIDGEYLYTNIMCCCELGEGLKVLFTTVADTEATISVIAHQIDGSFIQMWLEVYLGGQPTGYMAELTSSWGR